MASSTSHARRRSAAVLCFLFAAIALAVALSWGSRGAEGAPYVPAAGSVVLEAPDAGGGPKARELTGLRTSLAADPENLSLAVRVARLDIEEARARSDPRFLGYAQAALAPWWDVAEPPAPVLLLRATIRQSTHDFERALVDLDRLVTITPDDPQAWLTRSVVLAVRGRYDEARASCAPLRGRTSPLVVAVCSASIDGVTGDAAGAYERLSAAARQSPRPEERSWAASILGEIAVRRGDVPAAEESFKAALASDPDDAYVLGAYADLLLDEGRPAEAATLVRERTVNDALLLRLALAETAMHRRNADELVRDLSARFDASHLRGDTVHRREESRFALGLLHDAPRALELAKANWDVQKEPWDVRVLLEAAAAAHDTAAAKPALDFLDRNHLEDPRIRAEAAALRGKP